MIKIYSTLEEFQSLEQEWKQLLYKSASYTPFQTYEYNYMSWKQLQCKDNLLYLIVCLDPQNIVLAICPFYIDKKKSLRFINDKNTDFCEVIIKNDKVDDYHVWREITDTILSSKWIHNVVFENLRGDSPVLSRMHYLLSPSMIYCHNAYPKLSIKELEGSEQPSDSIPNLTAQERKKLRNLIRKVGQYEFKVLNKEVSSYPSDIVEELTNQMIIKFQRKSSYIKNLLLIIESLYTYGIIELFVTYHEVRAVAMRVFLKMPGTKEYISWLVFYSEKNYNQYNMLKCIEYISTNGGVYNFARGTYGYKMKLLRPPVYNLYSLRWSKSLFGQLCDVCYVAFYHFKQIIKKIIRG